MQWQLGLEFHCRIWSLCSSTPQVNTLTVLASLAATTLIQIGQLLDWSASNTPAALSARRHRASQRAKPNYLRWLLNLTL